jgi:O-antigen ligase
MATRLATFAFWALLLLPLVISPPLGLLTPYAALLVIIPLFFAVLIKHKFGAAYASWEARAFFAVCIVLAIVFVATADSVSDGLRAFNFTMLFAYGAIAWVLSSRAGEVSAERVTQLAGLGVVLGFMEVAVSALLGSARATGLNIGPIVLSNALLALGFISLGGMLLRRDRWAWAYVVPPVLAIAATLITTSRGPLLSVPFAVMAAGGFVWHERFNRSGRAALIGLAALVVVGGALVLVALQGRARSIVTIFNTLIGGGTVVDESARERLVFYSAGWQSFLASPWIGHGWGNIMSSIQGFLAPADVGLTQIYKQLHNDVLNFAVGAGIVGVICYFTIISAPLIGAWRSPRDGLRAFRLYGATVLTVVYVAGGLTDLMFGFEFHTFLFIMLTAILLGLCRESPHNETAAGAL